MVRSEPSSDGRGVRELQRAATRHRVVVRTQVGVGQLRLRAADASTSIHDARTWRGLFVCCINSLSSKDVHSILCFLASSGCRAAHASGRSDDVSDRTASSREGGESPEEEAQRDCRRHSPTTVAHATEEAQGGARTGKHVAQAQAEDVSGTRRVCAFRI